VVSVAGSTATMDRAVGTAASTGGTGNLGGALASPGVAAAAKVGGNWVWVRAGTYPCGATANVAGGKVFDSVGGNGNAQPSRWAGYEATRGDNCPTGNRPVLQAGAASMIVHQVTGADNSTENLAVANPSAFATVTGFYNSGARTATVNCTVAGCTNGFQIFGGSQQLADCLVTGGGSGGVGIDLQTNGGTARRCSVLSFAGLGFNVGAGGPGVVDCLAAFITGTDGFSLASGSHAHLILNCTAHSARYGFVVIGGSHDAFENCVATSCSAYGFHGGFAASLTRLLNCAGYNNTSGNYLATTFQPDMVRGFVALTASPYANAAGLDFSPNTAAGGGAAIRGKGAPATLPGTSTASYPDIGVSQSAAAGGASVPPPPLMPGTFAYFG
jgi:hypothetical protein